MIRLNLLAGSTGLDGVALLLDLGLRTLRRRCKEASVSCRDLVSDVRLERGMTLLATTALPVTQIALSLGNSDPSHFARAFWQKLNVPPSCGHFKTRPNSPNIYVRFSCPLLGRITLSSAAEMGANRTLTALSKLVFTDAAACRNYRGRRNYGAGGRWDSLAQVDGTVPNLSLSRKKRPGRVPRRFCNALILL